MSTNEVNGVRLYWEIAGDVGDPLVLVHGSWGDHQSWASVVPALSRSFRVLVDRIHTVVPNATVYTYEGGGHVPYRSHPDKFVKVVTEFPSSSS